MYEAPNYLSNSDVIMSENQSEEAGFISRKAFDEACQELAHRSGSRSSNMSLESRRDVRSPCLSAPFFPPVLISSLVPHYQHRGTVCIFSPIHAHVHLGRTPISQDNTSSNYQSISISTIKSDQTLLCCAGFSQCSRIQQT